MGLDMYAYRRKKGQSKDDMEEIMYWRKHNRLHGLMEEIYREKGGQDDFNCVTLRLKKKDMKRIIKTILVITIIIANIKIKILTPLIIIAINSYI